MQFRADSCLAALFIPNDIDEKRHKKTGPRGKTGFLQSVIWLLGRYHHVEFPAIGVAGQLAVFPGQLVRLTLAVHG